jgi:hypothetical protein
MCFSAASPKTTLLTQIARGRYVTGSAYQPFTPARRPGGRPAARPRYQVLVHRKFAEM